MSTDLKTLIAEWSGQAVLVRYDNESGTWIFIAIHDGTLGRPSGGTRMKVYERPEDGLRDAMRLAEGMTYKWASLGLPIGGGKAVLAIPAPMTGDERTGLLHRYGEILERLCGAFATGEDLGTTPKDMATVGEKTRYVHGVNTDGSAVDPGPFTARGVFCGMRACLRRVFDSADFAERTVLIQGLGDVGEPLAKQVHEAGARLLVSDIDPARSKDFAARLGVEVVEPGDVYSVACDIFAPCAIGGILNDETISQLQCRIVAGSANNQLEEDVDADRLHSRDILYAPDYVVNGGGALALGLISRSVRDEETLLQRMEAIGSLIEEILQDAAERLESPFYSAQRRAREILETAASFR